LLGYDHQLLLNIFLIVTMIFNLISLFFELIHLNDVNLYFYLALLNINYHGKHNNLL